MLSKKKKAGEIYWGIGTPLAISLSPVTTWSYGFSLMFFYETKLLRMDSFIGILFPPDDYEDNFSITTVNFSINYLFFTKNFTPYLGAGFGYSSISLKYDRKEEYFNSDSKGGAFVINAGVEMFRFHFVRMLIDAKLILPLFNVRDIDYVSDKLKKVYVPAFLFELTFLIP